MTVVECALLLGIFLLFLFGILEYARYLFTLHITTNAARDAARYSTVKVKADPPLASTAVTAGDAQFPSTLNYSSTRRAWEVAEITDYLKSRMGPRYGSAGSYTYHADKMISGMNVRVFPCEQTTLYTDPPVLQPKSGNTGWNNAQFTERIAVQVTGTYVPILPNFLWMGNTSNIDIVAVMGSEG